MLTRKRIRFPIYIGDTERDFANLTKAISDYLLSLEDKNSLTISQAQIYVDQGLQFPATQVSSSDANNLDDYEEGAYTPTPSPQTGAFTTVSASGRYTKIGRSVFCSGSYTITTVGTGAGLVTMPIPFTAGGDSYVGAVEVVNTGSACTGWIQAGTAIVTQMRTYNNASLIAAGAVVKFAFHYTV